MPLVELDNGQFGWDYHVINTETGEDRHFDSDWDYPFVAGMFGWQPCHEGTDGTVDCPICGKTASELILSAQEYLDSHIGDQIPDPCFFDN